MRRPAGIVLGGRRVTTANGGPTRNRVLVLTYWPYRSGLIQSYTLPYLKMILRHLGEGSRLTLVTLEPAEPNHDGPTRRAVARDMAEVGIDWLPRPYHRFGCRAVLAHCATFVRLFWGCWTGRYRVVHSFCTPAGLLGYLLSATTRIPLVIDSYEPHAEAMVENGSWRRGGFAHRLLFAFEGMMSRRAAAVVAATAGMREYAKSRYAADIPLFLVKPACVDLELFRPGRGSSESLRQEFGLQGKVVGVYAGKVGGIYLDREIFEIFRAAQDHWGGRFRALMLTDADPERMREWCRLCGFDPESLVCIRVDYARVPDFLALADFALTPVKPVPTKRYCTPIKDGEYWAMGLPVIITPGISEDSDLIERLGVGVVLGGLSQSHFAAAIQKIDGLLSGPDREGLGRAIRALASERRSYGVADAVYKALYGPGTLLGGIL